MKASGLDVLPIGAKPGIDRTLRAMKKSSTRERIEERAERDREAGIGRSGFPMPGLPGLSAGRAPGETGGLKITARLLKKRFRIAEVPITGCGRDHAGGRMSGGGTGRLS